MSDYEVRGLEEMMADFENAVQEFPNEAEKTLASIGRKFKKAVIEKTPDSGKANKSKLNKKYKTEVAGYRENIQFNFWSQSPHFHLVERGHKNVAKDGREYGFTPGVHMVERTVQEFESIVPAETDKLLKRIIRRMRA